MKNSNQGDRVYFVNSFDSGMVLEGTVKEIVEAQTGNTCTVTCDVGGEYTIPERYILRKV